MKGCKDLGRNDHGPHLAGMLTAPDRIVGSFVLGGHITRKSIDRIKVMAEEVSMIWSFGKLDWPNGAVLPCEDFMLFWKD